MPDPPSELQVWILVDILELTEAEARGLTARQASAILKALVAGSQGRLSPEEVIAVLEAEGVYEIPSFAARRDRAIEEARNADVRQYVDRSEPHAN